MTPDKNPTPILSLPYHLINQIKAGEVVERPSNVLKELMENSIDAGSTRIDVIIKNTGLDQISVVDNGHGIPKINLGEAFDRHTTSKIDTFEDLYKLHTYGFRGEALASISSVSKIQCTSSVHSTNDGAQLRIDGGKKSEILNITKKQPGTHIKVEELFFNTPVRMKFLKSSKSERNSLLKIFRSFVLAHPKVHFTLQWDEEEKEVFHPVLTDDILGNAKRVMKISDHHDPLIFSREYEGYQIRGVYWKQGQRASQINQYLIINNRLIDDKEIHYSLLKNSPFKSEVHSHPYVLLIDIPLDHLDINVHPHKTTVKFFKPEILFSLLKSLYDLNPTKTGITSNPIGPERIYPSHDLPLQNNAKSRVYDHFKSDSWFKLLPGGRICFEKKDHIYLMDLKSWLRERLLSSFDEKMGIEPLLVAIPFSQTFQVDNNLIEDFYQHNIDLKRTEDGFLYLKGIPNLLSNLNFRDFLPLWIVEYLNDYRSTELKNYLKEKAKKECGNIRSLIQEHYLLSLSEDDLISSPHILELNDKLLHKLFNDFT